MTVALRKFSTHGPKKLSPKVNSENPRDGPVCGWGRGDFQLKSSYKNDIKEACISANEGILWSWIQYCQNAKTRKQGFWEN